MTSATAAAATVQPHVLVVDDDARLRELLRRYLGDQGFLVATAANAGEARHQLGSFAFDLIVLDVMMPGENGFELTRALRRDSTVPILLLTAMGEVDDRIKGLEHGADDYLGKPFEPRELVLRMRTILKRAQPSVPARAVTLRLGSALFDLERRTLRRDGVPVHLTESEAALLALFASSPGVTLTREDLAIAGGVAAGVRTIDVQVTRLRRKIEPDPKFPRYLHTVRGKGYVLHPD